MILRELAVRSAIAAALVVAAADAQDPTTLLIPEPWTPDDVDQDPLIPDALEDVREELARRVWEDASAEFPFDFFGSEATCDWPEDAPCVTHPTFRGGTPWAYDACANSMIAAFGDERLSAEVEPSLLFGVATGSPGEGCASLLVASGEVYAGNVSVEDARDAWLVEMGVPPPPPPAPFPESAHSHSQGQIVHAVASEPAGQVSNRCLDLIYRFSWGGFGLDPHLNDLEEGFGPELDELDEISALAEFCCEEDSEGDYCLVLGCLDFATGQLNESCECRAGRAFYEILSFGYDNRAMDACCVPGEDADISFFSECLDNYGYLQNPPALCEADPDAEACACLFGTYLDETCDCGAMLDLHAEDPLWALTWGVFDEEAMEACCVRGNTTVWETQSCVYENLYPSSEVHWDEVEAESFGWPPEEFEPVPENCIGLIMESVAGFGEEVRFNETECCANHTEHPYCVVLTCYDFYSDVHLKECDCGLIHDVFGHESFPEEGSDEITEAYLDSCCTPGENTFEYTLNCMEGGTVANPPALCTEDPAAEACACLSEYGYLDDGCDCGTMLDLYAEDPLWGLNWGVLDLASLESCCVRGNATVGDTRDCIFNGRDCGEFYRGSDDDDYYAIDRLEECCIPGNTTYGEATECLFGGGFFSDDDFSFGSDDFFANFSLDDDSLFGEGQSTSGGLGLGPLDICAEDPDAPVCKCMNEEGDLDETCGCEVMLDLYSDESLGLGGLFEGLFDLESCCTPGIMTVADTIECLFGGSFGSLLGPFVPTYSPVQEPVGGIGEPADAVGPVGGPDSAVPSNPVTEETTEEESGDGGGQLPAPVTTTNGPTATPTEDELDDGQDAVPVEPEASNAPTMGPIAEKAPNPTTAPTAAPVAQESASNSPTGDDPNVIISNRAMAVSSNAGALAIACVVAFAHFMS